MKKIEILTAATNTPFFYCVLMQQNCCYTVDLQQYAADMYAVRQRMHTKKKKKNTLPSFVCGTSLEQNMNGYASHLFTTSPCYVLLAVHNYLSKSRDMPRRCFVHPKQYSKHEPRPRASHAGSYTYHINHVR